MEHTEGRDPAGRARVLVVMRHAKAEPTGSSDRERRLTERGRADAAQAGAWLASTGVVPTHALVSDAARALETWEALHEGWSGQATEEAAVQVDTSASLYAAGPETALDLVREADPSAETLVVVGHNPTMAFLVQLLDDGSGDADAVTELAAGGYPTGALTVFEVRGEWTEVSEGSANVRAFHVARS